MLVVGKIGKNPDEILDRFVALDTVGAGEGMLVGVVEGAPAQRALGDEGIPADAVIVAIFDESTGDPVPFDQGSDEVSFSWDLAPGDGRMFRIEPGTTEWWLTRPLWVALLLVVTAGLVALLDQHQRAPFHGDRYVAVLTGRKGKSIHTNV